MHFSAWVKNTRVSKGLSQEECAARAGVSQSVWSDYEKVNTRNLRKATVGKIAFALGVTDGEALEAAGYTTAPDDVPAEWRSLWLTTPADRREKLLNATRGVKEAIASF